MVVSLLRPEVKPACHQAASKPFCEEEEEEAVLIIYNSCIEYMGRTQPGVQFSLSNPSVAGTDERLFKHILKFYEE